MGILDKLFRRDAPKIEKRAEYVGPTHQIVAARAEYLFGRNNLAELTATVQTAVSHWEHAFALADIDGTSLLTPRHLAMAARGLALTGEALFVIRGDSLAPATDWTVSTRRGVPTAYRATVADVSGGAAETLLAAEVLHFRIGSTPAAPWAGSPPLARASLSADLLAAVETAMREVYAHAPLGSSVIPMPESAAMDLDDVSRGFLAYRGRVLARESVNVAAAGGPVPQADWKPAPLTPDINAAGFRDALQASRGAILQAYGILPALFETVAQGPLVREAQRHLATWTLQPIAALVAQECSEKLAVPVAVDVLRPVQAYDVGGRARAFATIVEGIARAKEAGLTPEEVNAAATLVNWGPGDGAA